MEHIAVRGANEPGQQQRQRRVRVAVHEVLAGVSSPREWARGAGMHPEMKAITGRGGGKTIDQGTHVFSNSTWSLPDIPAVNTHLHAAPPVQSRRDLARCQ